MHQLREVRIQCFGNRFRFLVSRAYLRLATSSSGMAIHSNGGTRFCMLLPELPQTTGVTGVIESLSCPGLG